MKFAIRCCQAAVIVSLLVTGPAPAQKKTLPAGEGQERLLPTESWKDKPEEEKAFQNLRRGDQPITPEAEAVIDHAAQWFAYRLTWTEYHEYLGTNRTIHSLRDEGLKEIIDPNDPKTPLSGLKRTVAEEFNKRFAERLREVVKNPKPIARLNAAMLLARVAATGQEEAADALADVIRDPKENDGIKLWAVRGLRDFFALLRADNPIRLKKKEAEGQWAKTLLDYVNRPIKLPATASHQEWAAIPYVRVEAISALGQTRYPAVATVEKKNTIVQRPTALGLLRIIANQKEVEPPPTLAERVAAVSALCQLQAKLCEDYQPDYVAHVIGRFVVELGVLYNQGKTREPWRLYASRLMQALNEFKTDLQGPPANDNSPYVTKMVQTAEPLLREMASDSKGAPDTNSLSAWLGMNPPKHTTVYKSLPQSSIKEPEKKAE